MHICVDQRALGYSMRVERADVTKVKNKIDSLKRKPDSVDTSNDVNPFDKHEERINNYIDDEEKRKKAKKERELALKKEKEASELESMDPEVAALMGFGGFK